MLNLTNKTYGLLKAKRPLGSNNRKSIIWECECECGKIIPVIGSNLINRNTTSCGCKRKAKGLDSRVWKGFKEISGSYWYRVKLSARRRKIPFELNIEDCWQIFEKQSRKCVLSGIEIQFSNVPLEQTASLDRIDSKKGYTKDNVQWVHKDINKMKDIFQQDYFINICNQISNFQRGIS